MRLRHKVPTIFNIYMLDVICCALGCVVLLWQVSYQEAEEQTAAAISARNRFEQAMRDLTSASSDVTQLQAKIADWEKQNAKMVQSLAALLKERDDALKLAALRQEKYADSQASLKISEDRLRKLEADLQVLFAEKKKTEADLTSANKTNTDLLAKIALAEKAIAGLKGDLTSRQADVDAAVKKAQSEHDMVKVSQEEARKLQKLIDSLRGEAKDVQAKLTLTELQLKMREQDLDKSQKELTSIVSSKDKTAKELTISAQDLAAAKELIATLTKDRDAWKEKGLASNTALGTLKLEKDKLSQRVTELQAEAEQRFAGIPLTGENVVFLIDISGSMTMKDENTDDPDKWPFLCETLMKLMKSIPTLKRFQVILFSDKTSYLFGSRDSWFTYEGAKTAKLTHDALRKVKVEGGTNMQDAFEEAFRYRKVKLDTIYLFSDGLPNIGDGVPPTITKPSEAQRTYYMSKHVREKLKTDWNRPIDGQSVRINAVGFFFESPDVGAFLWALAREHKGSFVGLR